MEEEEDISSDGNAFAIPDLYKPSCFARFDDAATTTTIGGTGGMGTEDGGGMEELGGLMGLGLGLGLDADPSSDGPKARLLPLDLDSHGGGGKLKSGLLDIPPFDYGPVLGDGVELGVLLEEDSEGSSLDQEGLDDAPEVEGEALGKGRGAEDGDGEEGEEEDVWISAGSVPRGDKGEDRDGQLGGKGRTWEAFYAEGVVVHNEEEEETKTKTKRRALLSEGGGFVYDAALAIVESAAEEEGEGQAATTSAGGGGGGQVIQTAAMLSSLTQLAMGRESVVFRYDEESREFTPRKENLRMSGYSLQTFSSFTETLRIQGNRIRRLHDVIAQIQRPSSSRRVSRGYVALAGALSPILASLEAQIGSLAMGIGTLLQLQAVMERPGRILGCLDDVVRKTRGAETDGELLSRMFRIVGNSEHAPQWLLSILQGLFVATARPWLELVNEWVGFQRPSCSGFKSDFMNDWEADVDGDGNADDVLNFAMPPFITADNASMILETGRSLRLLEKHQPGHPLTKQPVLLSGVGPTKLEWTFSWGDVERVSTKANRYEAELRTALREFYSDELAIGQAQISASQAQEPEIDTIDEAEQSTQTIVDNLTSAFEAPLPDLDLPPTPLEDTNLNTTFSTNFAPPLSLIPTLSFTLLLSVRARLTNRALMRLLFQTHQLRAHLSLLHRFVLLSDGVFLSRLSDALFSPQPRSNSGLTGTGPNLGHRSSSTWLPASSNLRLALQDILTDLPSSSSSSSTSSSSLSPSSLLSFAIRPPSPSASPDPDPDNPSPIQTLPPSTSTLLHLIYTPPEPLSTTIITPSTLAKYDTLFTHLLHLQHLLSTVTHLSAVQPLSGGAAGRFRWEAGCFVRTVCGWAGGVVEGVWRGLERRLTSWEGEGGVDDDGGGIGGTGRGGGGVEELRGLHEGYLDRLLGGLLLSSRGKGQGRGRVSPRALLEEVFGVVVRFDGVVGRDLDGDGDGDGDGEGGEGEEIKELYGTFRLKVGHFVDVCRGLSQVGDRGRNDGKGEGEEEEEEGRDTMAALVGRLEVGGFC